MIKEALQYIVGMNEPHYFEKGSDTYSDKPLNRVDFVPIVSATG